MSTIRTSLPIETQPWESAKANFLKGLTPEEVKLYQNATLENLFYNASSTQRQHALGSRSWRLQARMSSLTDSIEDYGKAMDVSVNTYPLVLSPIWGSLRVILHIVAKAASFQEKLVETLAQIGDVLPRFHVYEILFNNHERVLVALSAVYLDLLRFCVVTKNFFAKERKSLIPLSIVLKGAWKNHLPHFDQYMVAFRTHSKRLEKEAKVAHMIESARSREIQLRNQALQLQNEKLKRRDQVLSSLPAVDYLMKQSKQFSLKHPGTCVWLQSTAEFKTWSSQSTSDCLCCYGIPGSGKSVLAANLQSFLLDNLSGDDNQMVCYHYFDYADSSSLDIVHVLASLIKQVLEHLPLDHFGDDFSCPFQAGCSPPTVLAATEYLAGILKDYSTLYLILDGLDELNPHNQSCVLELSKQLLQRTEMVTKVFVTSRTEELQVKKALRSYRSFRLSDKLVSDDIALYIKDKIEQLEAPHPLLSDDALKGNVIQALVNGAKGMFLWVKFQLFDIEAALSKADVRRTLENLPETLSETYLRIIKRAHDGPGGKARIDMMQKVFRWITVARRPLHIEELEEAVSLEPSDTYLHSERVPTNAGLKLVSLCGNLVMHDEDDDTVSFTHHTVRQYLLKLQSFGACSNPLLELSTSEEDVGRICMAYLSFSDFQTQLTKLPLQTTFDPILVQRATWSSIPLGAQMRAAVSWISSKQGIAQKTEHIAFAVPVDSTPTELLTKKYILLEYVIEYWVFHTSEIRSTSGQDWALLKYVALYLQLPFEFRPWNDHHHRTQTESTLQSLGFYDSRPAARKKSRAQVYVYTWALKHAVGSMLGLLDRWLMHDYFTWIQIIHASDHGPRGLNPDHIHRLLQNLPSAGQSAAWTQGPSGQPRRGWDGDLLLKCLHSWLRLSAHQSFGERQFSEDLLYFLSTEMNNWLDLGTWDQLTVDAAVQALRCKNTELFQYIHQHADYQSQQAVSRIVWETVPTFGIVKWFLQQPVSGDLWNPAMQWDLVFLLERYYAEEDHLLWISQSLPICTDDVSIAQALIVAALALGKPLSYIVRMATILKTETRCTSYFDPSGPIHSSFNKPVDSYQRIRAFLNVNVFALVRDLDAAAQSLKAGFSQENPQSALIFAIKEIVDIWRRYRESFSVATLENDNFPLLRWAAYYRATDMVTALLPLYADYVSNSRYKERVQDILDDCTDASAELKRLLRSLLVK